MNNVQLVDSVARQERTLLHINNLKIIIAKKLQSDVVDQRVTGNLNIQAQWIEFSQHLSWDILNLICTRRFLADSNAFKSYLEDIRVISTLYKTTIDFKELKEGWKHVQEHGFKINSGLHCPENNMTYTYICQRPLN